MQRIQVLWPYADFRRLFVSQAVSTLGDKMVLVALGLLVMDRTGSTVDLGLVVGAQSASLLCFLILGGVWADRLPRHRIVVASDVVRGALHALLAALVFADALTLGELVAIEVLFGAAEAFFQPACTALLPQTVPERLIQDATAATRFTQRVAGFAGPALATALVLNFGTGVPFAIDAATFLVSASLVTHLRPRPRGEDPGIGRLSLIADARAGFHEVRARPWIWVTIAVFSVYLVVAYAPYLVLGPAVAAAAYGRAAAWGWIVAGIGVGTAVGSLLGMRWRPRRPIYTAIVVTVPFGGLLVAAGAGFSLAIVLLLAIAGGTGLALFDIWWSTALTQRVPPAALARVSSYDHLGSYALLPLGVVGVGWLAQQLGATTVMAAGGALAMIVVLAALLPRETRQMGQPGADTTTTRGKLALSKAAA